MDAAESAEEPALVFSPLLPVSRPSRPLPACMPHNFSCDPDPVGSGPGEPARTHLLACRSGPAPAVCGAGSGPAIITVKRPTLNTLGAEIVRRCLYGDWLAGMH
eukprot:CAMPEP_0179373104 /NCGR_PEP_ID=MMETSP0797-20121207/86633_1 /TAXON_ID=47934 /ORGANISM="Dinophysis acuminata, Strain DAEP01" /LENGTH=103 /DNA_ID=CAMNT_0021089105 /DNA_START=451 /DNA_END=759 /DNA_ORIENTATION=-